MKLPSKTHLMIRGPEEGRCAELEILVDGGPLCVAGVWDWKNDRKVPGLYFIYFKRHGARLGPFYADLALADRGMKKALKAFPQAGFWEQPAEWYSRQDAVCDWIVINLGKPSDLVGGVWEKKA